MKEFPMLVESFNGYACTFDKVVLSKTSKYDDIFSGNEVFFRCVFYILKDFLEDKNSNELFIKIPIKELGTNTKTIDANWRRFQDVITDALGMATTNEQADLLNDFSLDRSCIGKVYYCHNDNQIEDVKNSPSLWVIVDSNQADKEVRPKELFPDKKHYLTKQAIDLLNRNRHCSYLMKCAPAGYDVRIKKHIEFVYNKIESYKRFCFDKQFNSALIIGFNDGAKRYERVYSNIYFASPVKFQTRYDDSTCNQEIQCFVGDRKYQNNIDDIRRNLYLGYSSKKVIYIGSEFEDYNPNEKRKIFEFSYRDMYHYFANDNFPKFKSYWLSFPWLNQQILSLQELMNDIPSLDDSQKKNILTRVFKDFVGVEIKRLNEEDYSEFENFLYDNTYLNSEDEEKLTNWYRALSYTEKTPKQQILDLIKSQQRASMIHVVKPYSYKRNLETYLKRKNASSIDIPVDIKFDSFNSLEIVKFMLSNLAMGNIHLLSYVENKKIHKFLNDESNCCNDEYRISLFDTKYVKIQESSEGDSFNLMDYFNAELFENLEKESLEFNTNFQRYLINDADNMEVAITGNVIISNRIIPISDIFDYKDDYLPIKVIYYKTPCDFSHIMENIKNFPVNQGFAYYSSLWKKKLKSYCEENYSGNIKEMHQNDFPFLPKNMMKQYVDPDSSVAFPRKFIMLLLKLSKLNVISKEEAQYLAAAYNVANESSSYGTQLKESLYNYQITNQKDGFLESYDRHCEQRNDPLNSDALLRDCLIEVNIININKIEK